MLVLNFQNQACSTAHGNHCEVRRGIIMPGTQNKLVGHIHEGWHATLIHRGYRALLTTPSQSFTVSEGDVIEIDASEEHSLEAIFGPVEYFCTGIKGF